MSSNQLRRQQIQAADPSAMPRPQNEVTRYSFFQNQRMEFGDEHYDLVEWFSLKNMYSIPVAQLIYAMYNFYEPVKAFYEKVDAASVICILRPESNSVELHPRSMEVTALDLVSAEEFVKRFFIVFTALETAIETYEGREEKDSKAVGQDAHRGSTTPLNPFHTISMSTTPFNFYASGAYVDEKNFMLTNTHLSKHSFRPRNTEDNLCFLWCVFYSLYSELQAKPHYEAEEPFEDWFNEHKLDELLDGSGRFDTKHIKELEDRVKVNISTYMDDGENKANIMYRSQFKYDQGENIKIVQIPFTNFVMKSSPHSRYMDYNEDNFSAVTEYHSAILFESFFHIKDMKKLCPYCDRAFTTNMEGSYYRKHLNQCLDRIKNCFSDDVQRLINYRVPKKYKYFEDMSRRYITPFVTGDFESIILSGEAKKDKNGRTSIGHKAFSYTLQYYNPFSPDKNITKVFHHERDSHLLIQFNKDLIEIAKEHERVMSFKPVYKEDEIQAPKKNSDGTEICALCEHPLHEPYMELSSDKVKKLKESKKEPYPLHWNHNHMENDNLNNHLEGWTHEQCNLKAQLANKPLKVYFHNLKSYDGAYVLSAIANDPNPETAAKVTSVLARGVSKFSELTVTLGGHSIKFSDSLQHLLGSLERIVGSSLKGDTEAFNRIKVCFEKYYNKKLPDSFIDIIKGKGIYPYKFLQLDNLNAKELPSIDWFYSDLTRSELSQEDYEHALKSWDLINKTVYDGSMNFLDYTLFYNMLDVFLLSECLHKYNYGMTRLVGIAPLAYTSSASAAAGAYFFKSQKKVNLYDVELQQLIRKNIRGGQSYTYIRNLDLKPSETTSAQYTGFYIDINSLYPTAMSRFKHNAKQINVYTGADAQQYYDKKIAHLTTDIIHSDAFDELNEGYMITCDMKSHRNAELQKLARIFPFQTKLELKPHLLSDFQNDMCHRNKVRFPFKKNVPHFYPVQQITLSHRLLIMLKKWGYEFHNVTEVRVFEQENLYREYLDILLQQKIKNSDDEFLRNQVKLLMNSVYGNTITNPNLFRTVLFENDIKTLRRECCHPMYAGMLPVPKFVDNAVDSDGNAVERKKTPGTTDFFSLHKHTETVSYDYNSMQGFQILDDSKYIMYEFLWHFLTVVLPHYNIPLDAFKMLMSDTDSFHFAIESKYLDDRFVKDRISWLHDINMKIVSGEIPDTNAKIGCLFDLHKSKKYVQGCGTTPAGSLISDYYLKHKEAFGLFKEEEINDDDFVSFKSVCAKVYYYKTSSGKEVFKSKGIMKSMIKKHMTAETFNSSIKRCVDAETNNFTRDEIRMSGFSLSQRSVTKKLISEVDLKFIEMNESEYLIYGEIDFEKKRLEANKRDALLASFSKKN